MRDVKQIPINEEVCLVISTDNSGSVGMKELDEVKVPYETVGYFGFRVAVMECMAAGAEPFSVAIHNFCGDESWENLVKGIKRGFNELQIQQVEITGSTESNFSMVQSAVGIIVLGKKSRQKNVEIEYSSRIRLAVIGSPLVGEEVIIQKNKVVPLAIFKEISLLGGVMAWPVGSKGILFELNQMYNGVTFLKEEIKLDVDVLKSSGPSTCFIVAFSPEKENQIREISGELFHPIQIVS